MRTRTLLVTIALLTLAPAQLLIAQISDPLPEPIEKRGLTVRIDDVVRLPRTLGQLHATELPRLFRCSAASRRLAMASCRRFFTLALRSWMRRCFSWRAGVMNVTPLPSTLRLLS